MLLKVEFKGNVEEIEIGTGAGLTLNVVASTAKRLVGAEAASGCSLVLSFVNDRTTMSRIATSTQLADALALAREEKRHCLHIYVSKGDEEEVDEDVESFEIIQAEEARVAEHAEAHLVKAEVEAEAKAPVVEVEPPGQTAVTSAHDNEVSLSLQDAPLPSEEKVVETTIPVSEEVAVAPSSAVLVVDSEQNEAAQIFKMFKQIAQDIAPLKGEGSGSSSNSNSGDNFFEALICALSDPEVVNDLQRILGSPQMKDLIIDSFTAERNGEDPFAVAFTHMNSVLDLVSQPLKKYPKLVSLIPSIIDSLAASVKRQEIEHSPVVHENTRCNGCLINGRVEFIHGVRYKSIKVEDFDLCQSCEASNKYQDSHGPFVKIPNPSQTPEALLCFMKNDPRNKGEVVNAFTEKVAGKKRKGYSAAHMDDDYETATSSLPEVKVVADLSFPDGSPVTASEQFVKTWVIKNPSMTTTWPACRFVHIQGEAFGISSNGYPITPLVPNREDELTIPFTAPTKPGQAIGHFQLVTPEGQRFGRFTVNVMVQAASRNDGTYDRFISRDELKLKYAAELETLKELGFADEARNLKTLDENGGNWDTTLEQLLN